MNVLEIQICGMSRSGNHAIADWIWAQAKPPKLLLNCAEGKTNPYRTCRPIEHPRDRGWRSAPQVDFAAEAEGALAAKSLLMHTYEDSWLRHAFSDELKRYRDAWLGASESRLELVILRDPFNLFASRKKMGACLRPHIAKKMWKQHARAALAAADWRRKGRIFVLYNKWAADRAYRKRLACDLGLTFTDAGFENVSRCNNGSSFDGARFDGAASVMETGSRWRHYVHDAQFAAFFDAEMHRISEALFGPAPAELAGGAALGARGVPVRMAEGVPRPAPPADGAGAG